MKTKAVKETPVNPDDTPQDKHFYASSVADWATTNDTRDLRALIKLMEEFGHAYNLWLVPLPFNADYDIKMYQPQVKGAQWLGYYRV